MDRNKSELLLKSLITILGKRIKSEREHRGWDQIEVVIRSGISQSVIYNLEAGLSDNINLKSIVGLSVAFEINLETLLSLPLDVK